MASTPALRRLLSPLTSQPGRAGVFTDFDGTLADIVDDPSTAQPVEGLGDVLDRLRRRYACVGVVSGRPVSFLASRVDPDGLVLAGLYGLEVMRDGVREDHPQSGAWRETVDDVASAARAHGPEGMEVEGKGLSITLHYRRHPEIADDVKAWAERQAARSGLSARPAKMSVELHPPVPADKGTAITELAEDCAAVLFIGDDVGDLAAFDALDRLAGTGVEVLRVAVRSDEAPLDLLERADVIVNSPIEALALLEALLDEG